jgi:hypothetical protein
MVVANKVDLVSSNKPRALHCASHVTACGCGTGVSANQCTCAVS